MAEEVILHTGNLLCLPQLPSAVASQSSAAPLFLSLHSGSCDVPPVLQSLVLLISCHPNAT